MDDAAQSADQSGEPPPPDDPSRSRSADPAPVIVLDLLDPGSLLTRAARGAVESDAARVLGLVAHRFGCGGEVRAKVVGDREMAAAHERWSGVEGTTDVLTFDLSGDHTAMGEDELGLGGAGLGEPGLGEADVDVDLLICADEADRRSSERGHARERELVLYILHGVLHCLGHDDHDEAGYAKMHALEDELLTEAGLGAVFGAAGRTAGPGIGLGAER